LPVDARLPAPALFPPLPAEARSRWPVDGRDPTFLLPGLPPPWDPLPLSPFQLPPELRLFERALMLVLLTLMFTFRLTWMPPWWW
jgi:hypothetical protein